MTLIQSLLLSLLFHPAASIVCPVRQELPIVEVTPIRKTPTFRYRESSAELAHLGAGAYAPSGVGPHWHKSGLTQPGTSFEENVDGTVETFMSGLECIYLDKIELRVLSQPTVWVANDFPPGSCMYDAVKDHEMKHVHAEEAVLTSHLGRIRAAFEDVGRGRTVFGPGTKADIDARYEQFRRQVDQVFQDEIDSFDRDEGRAQRAVDTLQEYQRISNLCADQLRGLPENGG